MPRLVCTFGYFVEVIEQHGFIFLRRGTGSHRRYRGIVNGAVMLVDIAGHRDDDEIKIKTLKSMIRQCGLPKSLFMR